MHNYLFLSIYFVSKCLLCFACSIYWPQYLLCFQVFTLFLLQYLLTSIFTLFPSVYFVFLQYLLTSIFILFPSVYFVSPAVFINLNIYFVSKCLLCFSCSIYWPQYLLCFQVFTLFSCIIYLSLSIYFLLVVILSFCIYWVLQCLFYASVFIFLCQFCNNNSSKRLPLRLQQFLFMTFIIQQKRLLNFCSFFVWC